MATPLEIRNRRLANDYQEMLNIKSPMIDWVIRYGKAPIIEAYEITLNIRTVVSAVPDYESTHKLLLSLPENYPQAAPSIEFLSKPPFHPNWYVAGKWCFGTWEMSEGLGHHIVRMLRTLQFDPEITNEYSPANREANGWYIRNKNSGIFPTDSQILPDPSRAYQPTQKRFSLSDLDEQSPKNDDNSPEPPQSRFKLM
jgi:ubiquitin-protein ligase